MAEPITTAEKAQQMGVTRRRVLNLIAQGRFKSARKKGRDWLIDADDLPDERHDGPPMMFRMMQQDRD